jgi:hypothetical protein
MSGPRKVASLGAAVLSLPLVAAFAMSHGEAQPRMWWVHEERVKPGMLAQYETASLDFVKMVAENRAAMPTFGFTGFAGADFTYTYLVPIDGLAGAAVVRAEFGALGAAAGARMADVMGRSGAATESMADWIVEEHPELSYRPASPRLEPGTARYSSVAFYYLQPGREMEARALAGEFVALWKAKGLRNGWRYYEAVTGGEMPLVLIQSEAKDAADWAAADAADNAAVGAEGQALFQKALSITRRFEVRSGIRRPDLSLAPPAAAKPK